MKLGSLKSGGRDGSLVVVNRALSEYVTVGDIAPTLQLAIDEWSRTSPPAATSSNGTGVRS